MSEHRAQAVRAYLQVSGIDGDRLQAVGMGEMRPIQEGDSDSVHATNRRVEFHIEVQE